MMRNLEESVEFSLNILLLVTNKAIQGGIVQRCCEEDLDTTLLVEVESRLKSELQHKQINLPSGCQWVNQVLLTLGSKSTRGPFEWNPA